ncbi:hypothetical protein DFS34DRAFT_693978 [Phlyctochytrium arcticum]|nr:hypothetical protein DFS34DRAFT_693978 [Phlyctochytrium arcticum]
MGKPSSVKSASYGPSSSSFFSLSKLACAAAFVGGLVLGCQSLLSSPAPLSALDNVSALSSSDPSVTKSAMFTQEMVSTFRGRKFYPEDFEKFFGLRHVNTLVVPDSLKKYVENHDITKDTRYLDDHEMFDNYARVWGPFINQPHQKDSRFYVKWAGDEKHFGVYTDQYIPSNAYIAEYTGVLTNSSFSTDYEWDYYSHDLKDDNGNELRLGVDSQIVGNIARFVNHEDDPNTHVIYVPWKNLWRLVYVSVRPIWPGQEVTVSYGPSYWETRKQVVKV